MCWMRAAARAFSSPVYRQARCRVPGDSSPAMMGVARRRSGDKASLRLGDATRLPYPDRAFDLVLASTVLHHGPASKSVNRIRPPGRRTRLISPRGAARVPAAVRPGRGWITTGIITVPEAAAGRTHRRDYRDFIATGGLPPPLNAHGFSVDQRPMVSSGAIGLYLALPRTKAEPAPRTPAGPTAAG